MSGPSLRCVVASFTCSGVSRRIPSTSPMHAAYIRAIDRASPMPPAAGISAAWTGRVLKMPESRNAPPALSALPSFDSGPISSFNAAMASGSTSASAPLDVPRPPMSVRDPGLECLGQPDVEVEPERLGDLLAEVRADAAIR